ncbi:MAG: hypothetical protein M1816_006632 [Peltula sp. TS41687]|nr:MAG: hypothetical protein M1816_006632 [Peltula sp. TS41687]
MSPTIASRHGQPLDTTPQPTGPDTPSASSEAMSNKSKRSWVASAMKRVVLSRSSNHSLRSNNEEAPSIGNEELSALEKMITSSSPIGNEAPPTVDRPCRNKALPTNKPLPSPPAALISQDEQSGSRSLVDASERPLRRTPVGKPTALEDWPTIFPEKASTPTGQHATNLDERYPKLSSTTFDQPNTANTPTVGVQRKPLHNNLGAGVNTYRRKPVPKSTSPQSDMASEGYKASSATSTPVDTAAMKKPRNFSHPRQTKTSILRARLSQGGSPPSEGDYTPSKFSNGVHSTVSKANSEVTQRRSSSGSHGSKNSINHVVFGADISGHYDSAEFDHADAPSNTMDISSGHSDSAQLGHIDAPSYNMNIGSTASASNHAEDSTTGKEMSQLEEPVLEKGPNTIEPVLDNLNGVSDSNVATTSKRDSGSTQSSEKSRAGHAPAKTVAGVRRTNKTRSNRFSGRYDIRLTGTFGSRKPYLSKGPIKPTSAAVQSGTSAAEGITGTTTNAPELVLGDQNTKAGHVTESSTAKEASSVQHPASAVVSGFTGSEDTLIHTSKPETNGNSTYHWTEKEIPFARESISGPLEDVSAEHAEVSTAQNTDGILDNHGYSVKRLSKLSPEHGPTLLISPNAGQMIMGSSSSDEESKWGIKQSRRAALTNEVRKAFRGTKIPTTIKPSRIPRSASSDVLNKTRRLSGNVKDKRAVSADTALHLKQTDHDPFITGTTQSHGLPATAPLSRESSKSTIILGMSYDGPADYRFPSAANNPSTSAGYTTPGQEFRPGVASISQDTYPVEYGNQTRLASDNSPRFGSGSRGQRHRAGTLKSASPISEPHPAYLGTPNPPFLSQPEDLDYWPPRSSSRSEYTTCPYISSEPSQGRTIDPRLSRDFKLMQEAFECPSDSILAFENPSDGPEAESAKRASHASKQSSQGSVTKLSMSKVRGLFRRGHSSKEVENTPAPPSSKASRKYNISATGSPLTAHSESSNTRTRSKERSTPASSGPSPRHLQVPTLTTTPPTTSNSPASNRAAETTNLAMEVIEQARIEPNGLRRERLLEMGKILVNVITRAHEAESAMEEAMVAADKAKMAYLKTQKNVLDVAKMIEEWKNAG